MKTIDQISTGELATELYNRLLRENVQKFNQSWDATGMPRSIRAVDNNSVSGPVKASTAKTDTTKYATRMTRSVRMKMMRTDLTPKKLANGNTKKRIAKELTEKYPVSRAEAVAAIDKLLEAY